MYTTRVVGRLIFQTVKEGNRLLWKKSKPNVYITEEGRDIIRLEKSEDSFSENYSLFITNKKTKKSKCVRKKSYKKSEMGVLEEAFLYLSQMPLLDLYDLIDKGKLRDLPVFIKIDLPEFKIIRGRSLERKVENIYALDFLFLKTDIDSVGKHIQNQ